MGKVKFHCGQTWYRNDRIRSRLKRVVKGQIWFYDIHKRLYNRDIKDINLNRQQRKSLKKRYTL